MNFIPCEYFCSVLECSNILKKLMWSTCKYCFKEGYTWLMQSVIAQDSIGDDSTQTLNLQTNIGLFPRRSVH